MEEIQNVLICNIKYLDRIVQRNCFNVFLSPYSKKFHRENRKRRIPSLVCLHLKRPRSFVDSLPNCYYDVIYGAKQSNKPLYLVLTGNCSDKANIFRKTGAVTSLYLYRALDSDNFYFIDFLIAREPNLICYLLKDDFLDILETEGVSSKLFMCFKLLYLDEQLAENNFNRICNTFLLYAILKLDPWTFVLIWSLLDHEYLSQNYPLFLKIFVIRCQFCNHEFVKCLLLILETTGSKYLKTYEDKDFYHDLLHRFQKNNVGKDQRLLAISACVKVISIDILDILKTYGLYGFKEEVTILLRHLNYLDLNIREIITAYRFVLRLEEDHDLDVDNLGFICRQTYCKLLQAIPKKLYNKNIEQKLRMVNSVPALEKLSTYHTQKCIKNFFKVNNHDEFVQRVRRLHLPNSIMESIIYKPPLYY